jgi:transcriptional regulator with XRE-family HTH domain
MTEFQVAQIERGAKRIGATKMLQLCRLFDVGAQYFFNSWETPNKTPEDATIGGVA